MKIFLVWFIQCLQIVYLVYCDDSNRDKRYDVDSNTPFWANRGRRGEDTGPFWANRGRRTDKRPAEITQSDTNDEWNTQLEEPLYVEEPRWILVRRDDERRASSYIAPDYQPYFVTRGKRPIHHDKPRRDLSNSMVQAHRIQESNLNDNESPIGGQNLGGSENGNNNSGVDLGAGICDGTCKTVCGGETKTKRRNHK